MNNGVIDNRYPDPAEAQTGDDPRWTEVMALMDLLDEHAQNLDDTGELGPIADRLRTWLSSISLGE